MCQGRIVEYGKVEQVLSAPAHAYTQALLRAVPLIGNRPHATLDLGNSS